MYQSHTKQKEAGKPWRFTSTLIVTILNSFLKGWRMEGDLKSTQYFFHKVSQVLIPDPPPLILLHNI